MEKRTEYFAQIVLVLIFIIGCMLVLWPFLAAILLAAVICVSTWQVYLWFLRKLKDRQNLAALCMTLSLTLVIILPLALVAYNLADNVTAAYEGVKQSMDAGPLQPPSWLKKVPVVGAPLDEYWIRTASNREELLALAQRFVEPVRKFLLASGIWLGEGVMQMSLAVFISFFFYRDGKAILQFLDAAMHRIVGSQTGSLLEIVYTTVRGVMYGLLGTAMAQGIMATAGFMIAGVPGALLLGVITAIVSLVPVGPPLVWGAAAVWLFFQGDTGWGIFMLLWGFFLISSVDNVIKPILISRGSNLPFILGLFGVLGGLAAFGFVGVFIGPTLLAVALTLSEAWIKQPEK